MERYLTFVAAIADLGEELGTDTWGVELLLWMLGKGAPALAPPPVNGTPPPVVPPAPDDLYAAIADQGLVAPTELLTTLALSLVAKRFLILSGISGTGKTRIAIEVARYLDRRAAPTDGARAGEEPQTTAEEAFIPLSEANLRRGRFVLRNEHLEAFSSPEPGASVRLDFGLPDGGRGRFRLNNIGFTDPSRRPSRLLFALSAAREWLAASARPGQYLRFTFDEDGNPGDVSLVEGGLPQVVTRHPRYAVIAVRSDWTDPRGLLGYFNPITEQYARTPLLRLIERAAAEPDMPHLAILDEMNLARVEYYFSDLLSAMESGEDIDLGLPVEAGEEDEADGDLPRGRLPLPPNLLFLGTVNVDETTHAFSPKVLDRANVIEFSEVRVEEFLGQAAEPSASTFRLRDGVLDPAWLVTGPPNLAECIDEARGTTEAVQPLVELHGLLARFERHFGYRVMNEVMRYVGAALALVDGPLEQTVATALDHQFVQKVLPKLAGGREIETPLAHLLRFFLDGAAGMTTTLDAGAVLADAERALGIVPASPSGGEGALEAAPAYPRSARKVARMLRRLEETGFTSYLE